MTLFGFDCGLPLLLGRDLGYHISRYAALMPERAVGDVVRLDNCTLTTGQDKICHRRRARVGLEIAYRREIRPQYQRLCQRISEVSLDFPTSTKTALETRLEEQRIHRRARLARFSTDSLNSLIDPR